MLSVERLHGLQGTGNGNAEATGTGKEYGAGKGIGIVGATFTSGAMSVFVTKFVTVAATECGAMIPPG